MGTFKKILLKIADVFGFHKDSKYVNNYLHRANIRSGIFMSLIVAALELGLIIRQHHEYIIPMTQEGGNYFELLFNYTSLFWLLMFMGFTMFVYTLFYLHKDKTHSKVHLISVIVIASFGLLLCFQLPFEKRLQAYNPKKLVDTILLIAFYASIASFQACTIVASILIYKKKNIEFVTSILVIILFAACCLVFGVKVSYSDFFSSTEQKQIICFLTMVIYVACLLIWKPYISILVLSVIFFGFLAMIKNNAGVRPLPDGDELNYVTFYISLTTISVAIYNQRLMEARKDEELELLATKDKLTDLYSFQYFLTLCKDKIHNDNLEIDSWIYLFMDIASFKVLNDQKGFETGNEFLINVGKILTKLFPTGIIARQSDDHFAAFVPSDDIQYKLKELEIDIKLLDQDIRPGVNIGGCLLYKLDEDPHVSIEKARYACSSIKHVMSRNYAQYDEGLHKTYNLVQYIVSQIDEAVKNDWIKAYYQPVVYSKDHKLCGVEALARWIDPKYGFLNPGIFINALEDAQLAYKVDLAILEIVCRNMRKVLDNNQTIVPTSINISRSDFSIIDVPSEIVKITSKYNIPCKYLHIEITESALLDEHVNLEDSMRRIKEAGFSLWLDDFGSGYSSFNTLKDYSFDVLKLDMEFLKGFDTNKKSKPLIKSIIEMANQIGMRTLAEGVETIEQATFLKEIGCEKLQGYLFSKPITYEELNDNIASGKLNIADVLD